MADIFGTTGKHSKLLMGLKVCGQAQCALINYKHACSIISVNCDTSLTMSMTWEFISKASKYREIEAKWPILE